MYTPTILLISIIPLATTMALLIQQGHLLMSLLCLESIMLSLVLMVTLVTAATTLTSAALSVIMLTLGACEASLGLGLLVVMSRTYGSDLMNSLSSNKC